MHVEVFADITMSILLLEIQTFRSLENIVIPVI